VKRKILRLERDTIVEATFELRFSGTTKTVADILPGVLFAAFKARSPTPIRLALASVPREFQAADDNLRYAPRQGLTVDQFRILFGDYTVQVSVSRPYVGWARFKAMILETLGHIQQSGLIAAVERCSLKYVNLLEEVDIGKQFSLLKLKALLADRDLTKHLTIIRTELPEEGTLTIVELSPGTTVKLQDDQKQYVGIIVSVDTLNNKVTDFWENQDSILEHTHETEKSIYFDTLSEDTIASLGPVYAEK
jgi:uncharacterized protein (TIGR04255 family)